MKILATRKSEQNRAAIDPWTLVHFSTGMAFGLIEVPMRRAMAASIAYELVEQVFERQDWGKKFFVTHGPESLPNSVTDSVVFAMGHRLGVLWNHKT